MAEEKYTVEDMALALDACNGFVSVAARSLKCSPKTVRNYLAKYEELQAVREEARERWKDVAESQLMRKVRDGNLTAVIFTLKCIAKDRGYVERTETTGKDGASLFADKKAEDMTDAELLHLIHKEPQSA